MKLISYVQAAALVEDGWTVSTSGFTGSGHPEGLSTAIEKRFLETGHPRDLDLLYAAGQGEGARAIDSQKKSAGHASGVTASDG